MWLRKARAGLEPEDVEALIGTTLHAFETEGAA